MTRNVEMNQAGFEVFKLAVTRTALWQGARAACDEALARGQAFVAILPGGGDLADERVLADVDLQRADRYRQAVDRQNFILGRTMVHHLVRPQGALMPFALSSGAHGKPFLSGCPAFNLSHSADWVACAVSPGEPVGVDIEAFLHLGDYQSLLAVTTHAAERKTIAQAEPDQRLALFQRCWTRKEAVLKATGKGLSDDLCSIDVRLAERQPVIVDPAVLRLVDLPVADERVKAAVALDVSLTGLVVAQIAR